MMLAMTASDAASDANAGSKLVSAIENATRSVFACVAGAAQASKKTRSAMHHRVRRAHDNHRRIIQVPCEVKPLVAAA
jgi:hypothetical protein